MDELNDKYTKFLSNKFKKFEECAQLRRPGNYAKGVYLAKHETKRLMCKYQDKGIPRSLWKFSKEYFNGNVKENDRIKDMAIKCFKDILHFTEVKKSDEVRIKAGIDVLKCGGREEVIRDEVYCQLLKQTTECPRPDVLYQGWLLLYFCARSFPAYEMKPYVLAHCARKAEKNMPTRETMPSLDSIKGIATNIFFLWTSTKHYKYKTRHVQDKALTAAVQKSDFSGLYPIVPWDRYEGKVVEEKKKKKTPESVNPINETKGLVRPSPLDPPTDSQTPRSLKGRSASPGPPPPPPDSDMEEDSDEDPPPPAPGPPPGPPGPPVMSPASALSPTPGPPSESFRSPSSNAPPPPPMEDSDEDIDAPPPPSMDGNVALPGPPAPPSNRRVNSDLLSPTAPKFLTRDPQAVLGSPIASALPPAPIEEEKEIKKKKYEYKAQTAMQAVVDINTMDTKGNKAETSEASFTRTMLDMKDLTEDTMEEPEEPKFSSDENKNFGGVSGILLPPSLEELEREEEEEKKPIEIKTKKGRRKPKGLELKLLEAQAKADKAGKKVEELEKLLKWAQTPV